MDFEVIIKWYGLDYAFFTVVCVKVLTAKGMLFGDGPLGGQLSLGFMSLIRQDARKLAFFVSYEDTERGISRP